MKTPGEKLYNRIKYIQGMRPDSEVALLLHKYEQETCCSSGKHDPTWTAKDRGDEIAATLVVAREAAAKLGRMIPWDSSTAFRNVFLELMNALEQEL